jgi:2-dehydropantoate 2-reductase
MNRYVVLGAGAIGAGIGGRLAVAGADVTLIARGDHLLALQDHGLVLRSAEGTDQVDVDAVAHVKDARIGPADVVVLATKSQDTAAALAQLVAAGDRQATVVCAQNGVDNERQALRFFPNVYGMCVMMPAGRLESGVVDLGAAPVFGILDVGRYPSGSDDGVEQLAAELRSASFASLADPAIMARKYRKLLLNLGNVLDAAIRPHDDGTRELRRRAMIEAEELLAAAGIAVGSAEDDRERRQAFRYAPIPGSARQGSSSWQSIVLGRPTIETDYLNGEIVLIARQLGRRAPINEALVALGDRMVRERLPARSLGTRDLAIEG